jgi:hypothetical protein
MFCRRGESLPLVQAGIQWLCTGISYIPLTEGHLVIDYMTPSLSLILLSKVLAP